MSHCSASKPTGRGAGAAPCHGQGVKTALPWAGGDCRRDLAALWGTYHETSRTSAAKQLLQHALGPRTRNTARALLPMCEGHSLLSLAPAPCTEPVARTNSSCATKSGPPARGKAFVPPKWPSGRKHPSPQQSSGELRPGRFLAGLTSKLSC